MPENREERKVKLRDWLTAISQLEAVEFKKANPGAPLIPTAITLWWRRAVPGLEMTDKWIIKALRIKR